MEKGLVYAVFLFVFAAAAFADVEQELAAMRQQIQQQQQMLEALQSKLAAMEAKQMTTATEPSSQTVSHLEEKINSLEQSQAQTIRQQQAMSQKLDDVSKGEINWPKGMEWLKKVKLKGDLRYRYEWIDEENSDNRNRNRIRARLGLDTTITEDVNVGIRFATSEVWGDDATSGDAVSTNQTLDDAFSKKAIWLDLAYFQWSPSSVQGLSVIGGKMENPFYRAGGNQLIWDGDLTPEGIAVQYNRPLTDSVSFFGNAGGFYVDEVKSGADTSMWGGQAGLKKTFENKSYLLAGAGMYSYGNLIGHDAFVVDGSSKFFGNSNSGGKYTGDYKLVEFFTEYGFDLFERPTAVYGSYVKNTESVSSGDTGWLIGTKYGKCKNPGSWELSYDYRKLEKDAVLGIFSDSDFIGGGTNGRGHRFAVVYQMMKNVQAGLSYFVNEKGDDSHNYNRLQADMMFKF